MKRLLLGLLMTFAIVAGPGCQPNECKQLDDCCAASADLDGIGSACGKFSTDVRDPDKCRMITKTITFMYEDRSLEVPSVCRVK